MDPVPIFVFKLSKLVISQKLTVFFNAREILQMKYILFGNIDENVNSYGITLELLVSLHCNV